MLFIGSSGGRLSGASETMVCTHCEVTFRLDGPLADAHYHCVRCRKPVGPAASAEAEKVWLYSGEAFQGFSTYDPGQTWGDQPDQVSLPSAKNVGSYEIVEEIGRGGMGVVYQAWDANNQRYVALKLLLAGSFAGQDQVQRFLREARAAAKLEHEALVRVYDIGNYEGQLFFAMAFVEGVTLRAVLDSAGTLPVREACRIAAVIARGLSAAHDAGFAHRDVKPANILIEPIGRAYLTDFGLVIEAESSRLTQTGTVMGTPSYMAPELARGTKNPDWALADVYALGSVLYEMLTGKRAFDGEAGMQVLLEILADPPTPASTILPTLPRDVDIVIQRAMARDPAYRYQSAAHLAEDLERCVSGEPIEAKPLSTAYRALQFGRRHRTPLVAIVGTVALTVLGTVAIWTFQSTAEHEAEVVREELAAERLLAMNSRVDALIAEGRIEEADRAFLTFTSAQAHAQTAAVGEAWLAQARRQRAAGELKGELTALGSAFTSTADGDVQDRALLEIVHTFRERWWWDRMDAALDLINVEDDDVQREVTALRVETAVALGDLQRALELWKSGSPIESAEFQPLIASIARGESLEKEARRASTVDLDGDGKQEIVLFPRQPGTELTAVSTDLTEFRHIEFVDDSPGWLYVWDAEAALFAGTHRGQVTAFRWTTDAFKPLGTWYDAGSLAALTAVDVDGDGNRNTYLGFGPYTRHLAEVNLESGELTAPHPPTDLTASDITALQGLDLTGDGQQELVVAAGAWSAYDLRVLAHRGDGLKNIGRTRIGYVGGTTALTVGEDTLLVAAKSNKYPSIQAFPTGSPHGPPAGLYLFGWGENGLEERVFLPAPIPLGGQAMHLLYPVAADLDGDGLQDLAVTGHDGDEMYLLLYRQRQDGTFGSLAIGGLRTMAAVDDRLLVAETRAWTEVGTLWLLGRGETFPPRLEAYEGPEHPVPQIPIDELGTWRRAEQLVEMGLIGQAADAFEDLGTLVAGTDLGGKAWLRAGGLREDNNEPDAALHAYDEAATHPIVAAVASLAAANLLLAENHFDASRALADRIRDDPEVADEVEKLWPRDRVETPSVVTTLSFDHPLSDAWHFDPVAVRRDALAGTLVVDAVTGHGVLASLPLERVGPMALRVDFELMRLEWAAGVRVTLRPADGVFEDGMGVGVAGWGGGGLLERQVGCVLPGRRHIDGNRTPVPGTTDPIKLHGELHSSYGQDELACRITDSEGDHLYHATTEASIDSTSKNWELVIETAGDEATEAVMLAQIAISGIEVRGAVLGSRSSTPATNPIQTAIADEAASGSALRRADPDKLVRALRSRSESLVPLAQKALGRDYFQAYANAWSTAAGMHDNDEWVQRSLLSDLAGLRELEPRTSAEAETRHQLLYLRGRARWRSGQPEAASADLTAVVSEAPADADRRMAELLFDCHRLLAAIALASGSEAEAIDQASAALARARSREIGIDRLLVDPQLGPMRDAPGWEAIFGG